MRSSRADSEFLGGAARRRRRFRANIARLALVPAAAFALSTFCSVGKAIETRQEILGTAAEALVNAGGEPLLRYAIGCALPADESFEVEDGTRFSGSLGIAPQWTERALNPVEQRWITACLLARTNLFGVHVMLSMRGPNAVLSGTVTAEEKIDYDFDEGAFYGDVWAIPPHAYVCFSQGENWMKDRLKRVCTEESEVTGVSRCGFEIAGKCEDVCEQQGSDGSKLHCHAGDATYDQVISVFLKPES
jgi:hypothetical protein